jgi:hypothetical protein
LFNRAAPKRKEYEERDVSAKAEEAATGIHSKQLCTTHCQHPASTTSDQQADLQGAQLLAPDASGVGQAGSRGTAGDSTASAGIAPVAVALISTGAQNVHIATLEKGAEQSAVTPEPPPHPQLSTIQMSSQQDVCAGGGEGGT